MLAKEGKIHKKKMQSGEGKKRTNHRNENESGDKGARSNANLPLNNVNQTQFSIVNMNMGALKSLLLMLLLFDVHTILFINKQLCEHEHRAHSTHSTHTCICDGILNYLNNSVGCLLLSCTSWFPCIFLGWCISFMWLFSKDVLNDDNTVGRWISNIL